MIATVSLNTSSSGTVPSRSGLTEHGDGGGEYSPPPPTNDGDTIILSAAARQAAAPNAASKSYDAVRAETRAHLDNECKRLGLGRIRENTRMALVMEAFEGLDRRALACVANDTTGTFSADEKRWAQNFMKIQESDVLLHASGSGSDRMAELITFLDSVSDEEKQSDWWKIGRATAQYIYDQKVKNEGKPRDEITLPEEDPLLRLILKALEETSGRGSRRMLKGQRYERIEQMPAMKAFTADLAALRTQAATG